MVMVAVQPSAHLRCRAGSSSSYITLCSGQQLHTPMCTGKSRPSLTLPEYNTYRLTIGEKKKFYFVVITRGLTGCHTWCHTFNSRKSSIT